MPIIKSAKKQLKQDKHRREENLITMKIMKKSVKTARKTSDPKDLSKAYSALDFAAKKNAIHKNKAARLKSRLTTHMNRLTSK